MSSDLETALAKIEEAVKVLRSEGYGLEAHEILEIVDAIRQETAK